MVEPVAVFFGGDFLEGLEADWTAIETLLWSQFFAVLFVVLGLLGVESGEVAKGTNGNDALMAALGGNVLLQVFDLYDLMAVGAIG